MPIDLSRLPHQPTQVGQDPPNPLNPSLDLSKLPHQKEAPASGMPAPHEDGPSGFRKLLGMGVRVGSGILSSEGGFLGAGISGGGEALAELAEGSDLDPKSIGVEAGFGAIPFGKVVKGGKTAAEIGMSALRSGGLGTAHTAISDAVHGKVPEFKDLATSFGLGGVMGGIGSAWAGRGKPTKFEVEPTLQTGEGTSVGMGKDRRPSMAPQSIPAKEGSIGVQSPSNDLGSGDAIPYGHGEAPVPSSTPQSPKDQTREVMRDQKNLKDVENWLKNKRAVDQARTDAGLAGKVPGAPSYSEGATTKLPEGGTASTRTSWNTPPVSNRALPSDPPTSPTSPLPNIGPAAIIGDTGEANPLGKLLGGVKSEPKGDLMDEFLKTKAPSEFNWPEAGGVYKADEIGSHKLVEPVTPAPVQEIPPASQASPISPSSVEPTSPSHKYALENYPDEVNAELDKLGAAYRGGDKSKGKELAEIRDFMSGKKMRESWKGKPVEPAQPSTPLEEGSIGDQVQARAGEGTKPLISDEPIGTNQATETDKILGQSGARPMTPEEIQSELDWIERLKKTGGDERGSIDPRLLRLGSTITGATIGAPIGSHFDEDNPGEGAIKGALAGGALGYGVGAGGEGLKNLTNFRNASLLTGPAQLKKPLSDLGAYIGLMGEKAAGGDVRTSSNLFREMLRIPTNTKNYLQGLKNPEQAAQAIGIDPSEHNSGGVLQYVARPFAAAQNATQGAMERAGVSRDEAIRTLMVGEPRMPFFKRLLDLQATPGVGGQIYRFLHPFARIGTNIAERGIERMPGLSFFNGDPETKVARSIIGGAAVAGGALTGMGDAENADSGDPTSPVVKGLRRAMMASYGLPFAAGEALTAPGGPKEVYDLIPGISAVVPAPGPKETMADAASKFVKKRIFDQFLPGFLTQDSGSAR